MAEIINKSSLTSKYSLPDGSEKENSVESNVSSTDNMTTSFTKEKSFEKKFAVACDEVKLNLVLTNSSTKTVSNIQIKDVLDEKLTFKAGSVEIDGVVKASFNPVDGFTLEDDLQPTDSTTISYTVTIAQELTTDNLSAVSTITYDVAEVEGLKENSNVASITVSVENVTIEKTSTLSAVISGQKLGFQNVVKNNGTTTNTEVFFKDPIPAGTKFVEGSVKIDNEVKESLNPETGFSLDDLTPGKEIVITFDVMVD